MRRLSVLIEWAWMPMCVGMLLFAVARGDPWVRVLIGICGGAGLVSGALLVSNFGGVADSLARRWSDSPSISGRYMLGRTVYSRTLTGGALLLIGGIIFYGALKPG